MLTQWIIFYHMISNHCLDMHCLFLSEGGNGKVTYFIAKYFSFFFLFNDESLGNFLYVIDYRHFFMS